MQQPSAESIRQAYKLPPTCVVNEETCREAIAQYGPLAHLVEALSWYEMGTKLYAAKP
jgi:hypothetical protein